MTPVLGPESSVLGCSPPSPGRTSFIGALILLLATTAGANQRPIFPSDYKPSPCAPQNACESFTEIDFPTAAFKFLVRDLERPWHEQHRDEMRSAVQPYCAKRATCLATPGNIWWFCNDVFVQELRAACDDKFEDGHDNTQCHNWMDTYAVGVDQRGMRDWEKAQACAKEKLAPSPSARKMIWWSVPQTIAVDYSGPIRIFTIDVETHVPVQATLAFEGQSFSATDPPTGKPTSYYPFNWPRKLVRIPNGEGHLDVVPPVMTIAADGYEPVAVRFPAVVPQMIVSMKRQGRTITVTAKDSITGKPVEAQVYAGEQSIGFTNHPIEFPAKSKQEIWVRSPFDAYSDVVVRP